MVLPCPVAISLKPGTLTPLSGLHPALPTLPEVGGGAKRGALSDGPGRAAYEGEGAGEPGPGALSATTVRPLSAADALPGLMEAEFDLSEAVA